MRNKSKNVNKCHGMKLCLIKSGKRGKHVDEIWKVVIIVNGWKRKAMKVKWIKSRYYHIVLLPQKYWKSSPSTSWLQILHLAIPCHWLQRYSLLLEINWEQTQHQFWPVWIHPTSVHRALPMISTSQTLFFIIFCWRTNTHRCSWSLLANILQAFVLEDDSKKSYLKSRNSLEKIINLW